MMTMKAGATRMDGISTSSTAAPSRRSTSSAVSKAAATSGASPSWK